MSGATARHNIVVNNIAADLRGIQLKRRCQYFTTDLRLLIPATGLYTYPDLMVICGRHPILGRSAGHRDKPPASIVEILSKELAADYDRGRQIPALPLNTGTRRLYDCRAGFNRAWSTTRGKPMERGCFANTHLSATLFRFPRSLRKSAWRRSTTISTSASQVK